MSFKYFLCLEEVMSDIYCLPQVLKNSGLVDLQQEESFGDVTLTLTPKLSEQLFST